jgi:hypothetical protein
VSISIPTSSSASTPAATDPTPAPVTGAIVAPQGVAMAVVAFTSSHRRIHAIDVITDPARLPQLT